MTTPKEYTNDVKQDEPLQTTFSQQTTYADPNIAPAPVKINNDQLQVGGDGATDAIGIITETSNQTVVFQAGEAITAGDAVCIVVDNSQLIGGVTDYLLGDAAARTQMAVKFIPKARIVAQTIRFFIRKVGAPVDNLTFEVQGDSSGLPDDTPITNGTSNTVGGGSLTTGYVLTTMQTASQFTLTAGTTYWLVLQRSGAVNAGNYYEFSGHNASYANFAGALHNGAAWAASSSTLFYFDMTVDSGSATYEAWKTDADNIALSDFMGFSNATVAQSMQFRATVDGVNENQSGLTVGSQYFISGTAGAISTSKGTYGNIVGLAISSTRILIQKQPKIASGQESFTISTVSQTRIYPVGFRPRLIYYEAGGTGAGLGESRGIIYSTSNFQCIYNNLGSGVSNADTNVTASYCARLISGGLADAKLATPALINDFIFAATWTDPIATSQTVRVQWHAIG